MLLSAICWPPFGKFYVFAFDIFQWKYTALNLKFQEENLTPHIATDAVINNYRQNYKFDLL